MWTLDAGGTRRVLAELGLLGETQLNVRVSGIACVVAFTVSDLSGSFTTWSGANRGTARAGWPITVPVRHSRDADAEVVAIRKLAKKLSGKEQAKGSVQLAINEVPCVSCIGAMKQFADAYPRIRMAVSFEPDKQRNRPSKPNVHP